MPERELLRTVLELVGGGLCLGLGGVGVRRREKE